ncbi:hypothetical protein [Natronobiforma cellulositropha]|uniref:hypothetical protein n=1 Tax=Natronobiforma cellulositropha TaxID=1679076 RepID=UPI0021D5A56F|nr:hypothetical protein [Natronobiforma cellulositropha]
MSDRPAAVELTSAFGFGVLVPAGSLFLLRWAPALAPASDALSVVLPLAWLLLVAAGTALLGVGLDLETGALVGGSLPGTLVGFWLFAVLVGWSFVMFAPAAFALLAVVLGAWAAYERTRRHRPVDEPPYGTWRHVFGALALVALAIPFLLIFA